MQQAIKPSEIQRFGAAGLLVLEQGQNLLRAVERGQNAAEAAQDIRDSVGWRGWRRIQQRSSIGSLGFVQASERFEHFGHIIMRGRVVGLPRQYREVGLDSLLPTVLLPERDSEIVERTGIVWIDGKNLPRSRLRQGKLVQSQPGIGSIDVEPRLLGSQACCPCQVGDRIGHQFAIQAEHPEQVQGIEMLWGLGDNIQRALRGGIMLPGAIMRRRPCDRSIRH